MSHPNEKNRIQPLPALAALVLSLALTGLGAYAFAKATGENGSAIAAYQPKGIVTIDFQ